MRFNKNILSSFDFTLPLLVIPLVLLSWFLINENNAFLGDKVLIYVFVGILVFVVTFLLPIKRMSWAIVIFYWINIVLLVAVDFFGDVRLGAQRWLEIPFVHFTFQPSETMKPALILMLAHLIAKNPPKGGGYKFFSFLKFSWYILLPFVLILKQPDLGTALVLLIMGFGVLFLIGVNYKIWLTLLVGFCLLSPILYANLHDYQKKRIEDFISKEPDYQVRQSIIAVGAGGLDGKEKEEATQTIYRFLPIATSDFIFPYFAERFGFLGIIGLFILYAFLIFHIFSMGSIDAKDYFLRVIAYCAGLLVFVYSGVNIAMTIGLAPVVGIPLPLFSYGGSSFITFMILFGLLEHLLAFKNNFVYNYASKNFLKKGP
ncbi:FtsW/RodA/SpoVE family cell cycle protein [Helicobacter canadensis]|uniref:Cell wall polymerase n=1 Tax=Helicobacter canadensis MIT 98-5491 TaxID=537970 RepID=C5ZWU2_9HELI|nr:FtsW/RodA/SpoVE family cell cycle protein [Helicobacter canadensis]EES89610.1 RodA protein mrdB [Helicobacter canadensis MIT 98-5491]EFR48401.1 putative rod shape-determining protein RodA [Helicobacter canadensis MIT 98-5491]